MSGDLDKNTQVVRNTPNEKGNRISDESFHRDYKYLRCGVCPERYWPYPGSGARCSLFNMGIQAANNRCKRQVQIMLLDDDQKCIHAESHMNGKLDSEASE